MEDRALIEQYAQHGSQTAFAELTRRYEAFVHAAALRLVGDADLAKDVVQNVFLCLAQKADALRGEPILAGWLGKAARFEGLKLLRDRRRRAEREQISAARAAEAETSRIEDTAAVERVREALERLDAEDRRALMLRYRDGRTLAEVAAILGIREDAAQKRISRALERLRARLGDHAVAASALGALLGAQAAPPAAAATCIAGAAAGAGAVPVFVTLASSIAMAKLKIAAAVCAIAALAAVPFVFRNPPAGRPALEAPSVAALASTADSSAAELESARAEIAALQKQVTALRAGAAPSAKVPTTPPGAVTGPEDLDALKRRVVDSRNDPADRLAALRLLRDRRGRDPQVVAAMAALAQSTADPQIRSDIFRQLHGTNDPVLRPALLHAVQHDASEEVRSEAAETLGDFASEPEVQAVLAAVSRVDRDSEVREKAAEAWVANAPLQSLRSIHENPEASDVERYLSSVALRKREGPTASQAAALLGVLKQSGMPNLRKEIVEELGKNYGAFPEIAEWMDHLASVEQDPKVRREAAKFSTEARR